MVYLMGISMGYTTNIFWCIGKWVGYRKSHLVWNGYCDNTTTELEGV